MVEKSITVYFALVVGRYDMNIKCIFSYIYTSDIDLDLPSGGFLELLNSTENQETSKTADGKQRGGKDYLCPYNDLHIIKRSRISQHIKEKHQDVLQSRPLGQLVEEVKVFTESKALSISRKRVRCDICDNYIDKNNIARHQADQHGVRVKIARMVEERERYDVELAEPKTSSAFLDEFERYISSFGGGNNKPSTARSHRLGIHKICSELHFEDPFEVVLESNRQRVSDFLKSECERIPSGVKRYIEGLTSLRNFLFSHKCEDIEKRNLTSSVQSFDAVTSAWTKSFTKLKKVTNASLRDKLDESLFSEKKVEQIQESLQVPSSFHSDAEKADFIGLYFCFGPGNAHRGDVPQNATYLEFVEWKTKFLKDASTEFLVR